MSHLGKSASAPTLGTKGSVATLRTTLSGATHATNATTTSHRYCGALQPIAPRPTAKEAVAYGLGGVDFRCPNHESSFGRQVVSWPHTNTVGSARFSNQLRMPPDLYRSPGPKYGANGAFGKQLASRKVTRPSHGFGTSTRDGALKQYAVWSFR